MFEYDPFVQICSAQYFPSAGVEKDGAAMLAADPT